MTKEQEKAIKVLKKYQEECIAEYTVELSSKNCDEPHAFYLHQQIEAIETVLNMLKEKDKEIEKKDKIIDLICYAMTHEEVPQDEYCICRDMSCEVVGGNKACKDCIKQYFERKSEEC